MVENNLREARGQLMILAQQLFEAGLKYEAAAVRQIVFKYLTPKKRDPGGKQLQLFRH